MNRPIAVIVATVLLLTIGFMLGRRPVSGLREQVQTIETSFQERVTDLEARAALAEGMGYVWQARAELLVAALDVERNNFGTASERAGRARDLLNRAAEIPGMTLDLTQVRTTLDQTLQKIGALESESRAMLLHVADELGKILDQKQA
jgi:hypothetical protein